MTQTTEVNISALPKQLSFLQAEAREVLYSGAFGAGKSRALCIKLLCRAAVPGAREGLCRKHLVTLKATTLRTLLESDGDLPPVLPKGSYSWNKTDKIIRVHGGGEIVYFGLDDEAKIGSYNLSGCAVDEAVELTEMDWTQLRGRIRVNIAGVPNQIYGACNPGPPSHFLAKRFGLTNGWKPSDNCFAVHTKSSDNTFLPQDYLNDLATFTGLTKKRYVDGLWVGSDGLVYDRWDRSVFVKERKGPWDRIIVGQDEGYTHPAVMLVVGVDNDGRAHVIEEFYKSQQLESAVVKAALDICKRHDPEVFIIDPAAAKLIAAMREAGIFVKTANNDVFGGIQNVQQRLVVAGDGLPRLTVDPMCQNTIQEFETYEWQDQKSTGGLKDKPKKEKDDAMDALRYALMHIDAGSRLDIRVIGAARREEREDQIWTTL